ncbi:MAG: DnaJ domain-containing protein [Pedobacter sp.]
MAPNQETKLIDACRILFGSDVEVTREFLYYLQPEGVRNAYRKQARQCHPDVLEAGSSQTSHTELFRRSVEAYEVLNSFMRDRKAIIPLRVAGTLTSVPMRKVERAHNEHYYNGPFPTIELKTGLYLYYSGAVSYQALVRSLLWQRSLRPPLGEFACSWGWIDQETVSVILRATHLVCPFGERALKLGLLSQSQLNILLLHQRFVQKPLGRYFVQNSLFSESELLRHLRELARHNQQVRTSRR